MNTFSESANSWVGRVSLIIRIEQVENPIFKIEEVERNFK
jgi:hypothetical protein